MIGNVVNDGRLFSLQAAEWLMLIGAASWIVNSDDLRTERRCRDL